MQGLEDLPMRGCLSQYENLFICNHGMHMTTIMILQAHEDLRHNMQRSVFCLVLQGDTASSRRLTETVLAGCIPVFLGPPTHDSFNAACSCVSDAVLVILCCVWAPRRHHLHDGRKKHQTVPMRTSQPT